MKKTTKLSAFTLIELLVVIAIIGILAGLMSGAISGVMTGANATKIGNNRRNIVNALLQANQDREAAALSDLWPQKDSAQQKLGPKSNQKTYSDANTYFQALLELEYIDGISLPDFAGANVEAVQDTADLATGGNLWCTLGGVGRCSSSYTPAIWSRNLDGIEEKDFENADAEDMWADKLSSDESNIRTPFGKELMVVVRKGGAMQVLKKKQISQFTFLGGATNKSDQIVILKTADEDIGSGS